MVGAKKVTQGEKRLLPFLLSEGERGNFNIWLTLFTATRPVCVFAQSVQECTCPPPCTCAWPPAPMYYPPHPPLHPSPPQITKQKGLASGEWVPLLLTPPDLPSWTIGHLRLVCTEEKKYMYSSTGWKRSVITRSTGDHQGNSSAEKYKRMIGFSHVQSRATQLLSVTEIQIQ